MLKIIPFLLAAVFVTVLPSCQVSTPKTQTHAPLPTVKQVNLKKYAGKWHDVAHLPSSFQKSCLRSTAEYTPNADGTLKVVNTCYKKRGNISTIEGTATPVPGSRNTRLKVAFKGLAALAPVPDEGNYWILALDPAYQWSMVGTPDRNYLWFLSRQPELPFPTYEMLKEKARALGFDTVKLLPEAAAPPGLAGQRRKQ